jgi:mannose-1-phosphate guanylyltransferase
VLTLEGKSSMIQQTVERLLPLAAVDDVRVITNVWLQEVITQQLEGVPAENILVEPCARNTAAACALTAFLLESTQPETVLGIFPSDQVIANTSRFVESITAGIALAAKGETIVVLGVPPTRPETGYGYIEKGALVEQDALPGASSPIPVHRVHRFREKPDPATAEQFLAAGNFVWNSGIFLWSVRTLVAAVREHIPDMASILETIAAAYGTAAFAEVLAAEYPKCENISVDYAILERRSAKGELRSSIYCLPADFDWRDIGSWSSLHEHLGTSEQDNVIDGETTGLFAIQSTGNYVYAPGRTVALLGVDDLVVVETPDALLITTRQRSQDVSKLVRAIHEDGREDLI